MFEGMFSVVVGEVEGHLVSRFTQDSIASVESIYPVCAAILCTRICLRHVRADAYHWRVVQ